MMSWCSRTQKCKKQSEEIHGFRTLAEGDWNPRRENIPRFTQLNVYSSGNFPVFFPPSRDQQGATVLEELQLGDVFEGTVPWTVDRDYIQLQRSYIYIGIIYNIGTTSRIVHRVFQTVIYIYMLLYIYIHYIYTIYIYYIYIYCNRWTDSLWFFFGPQKGLTDRGATFHPHWGCPGFSAWRHIQTQNCWTPEIFGCAPLLIHHFSLEKYWL